MFDQFACVGFHIQVFGSNAIYFCLSYFSDNIYMMHDQKPKRRTPVSYGGRSTMPDKSQQRSRSMSFSPDRVRVRGRSPAFNALAANFENPGNRNLSTPPPMVRKIYPKSVTESKLASKSSAIAALSTSFEKSPPTREFLIPKIVKGMH